MDEEYVERRPGDMETYRRLDAFTRVRLAPSAASMARIREALVAEAASRARVIPDPDVRGQAVVPLQAARWWTLRRVSRGMGVLLAAALTLGLVAGSVAASGAGGPLYGPRLWLESATLPAGAIERADAQVVRLDHRLAEVRTALADNDSGATSAALDAFSAILADLESQAVADPTVADHVHDAVTRHLAVLEALVGQVPPQAQAALQHALDRSDTAVDRLDAVGAGRPANPGGSGTGGSRGPGQGTGPTRTPQGAPPTAKPAKPDPKPKATQEPAGSPDATKPAPKPGKTVAPEAETTEPTERPGRASSTGRSQGRP